MTSSLGYLISDNIKVEADPQQFLVLDVKSCLEKKKRYRFICNGGNVSKKFISDIVDDLRWIEVVNVTSL